MTEQQHSDQAFEHGRQNLAQDLLGPEFRNKLSEEVKAYLRARIESSNESLREIHGRSQEKTEAEERMRYEFLRGKFG